MQVGELFTETVKKMKRLDFLNDFVRRKTVEKNKLSEEVAVFRKKNGKIRNNEYDIYIYQVNAKISEIEKSIEKCKIEMKALKIAVSEGLRECYAKAPDADFSRRTELAYKHAFGDKSSLVGYGAAGGLFGETKIVGAVVTRDKTKRCAVKEVVRAGEKNSAGRIVTRPEIIVWDYDKNGAEGEFRTEDDSFKVELKKRNVSELTRFVKETFNARTVGLSLAFAAIFSMLFALCVFSGLTKNVVDERFVFLFGTGVAVILAFSATAVVKDNSRFIDGAGLFAFVVSIVTAAIYAVKNPIMICFAPAFAFVYSVAVFILRFSFRKRNKTGADLKKYFCAFSGAYLAAALSGAELTSDFATVAAAVVYFLALAAGLAGGIYSAVKRGGGIARLCYLAAIFSASFALAATLVASGTPGKIISISAAAITLATIAIKRIKDEV